MLQVVLIIFLGIIFLELLFYFGIYGRFSFSKEKQLDHKKLPVSVIVCAKNEAENLKEIIPLLQSQQYSNFEIVLINDASYDASLDIMESFSLKDPRIKIVDVKNNEAFWGNKKYALTLGIKAAKNDYLLFTDADCRPVSDQWISEMTKHFSNQHTLILGYSPYRKIKNSFTNLLVRFETFLTAMSYFAFAKAGMPYMGVGRNLAYHRSEFYNSNGFINHMEVRSGDDDLFINEVSTKKNTTLCYAENAFTVSHPPESFVGWFRQKRRHVSTAKHYKFKHQFLLASNYILKVSFWVLAIILLSFLYEWPIVLIAIGVRLLAQYIVFLAAAKRLKCQKSLIALPVLELFLILFQFGIFIANSISKPNHWK